MEPNARQREAIESAHPNNVVIAGPGTGKSKVLLLRACWLVQHGEDPATVVLASFTNASVNDLRETAADEASYEQARACRMSTFHSLALRSLLKREAMGSGVFIADDWEERFLIDPLLKSALGLPQVRTAARRRRDFDARWCQATEDPQEWLSQGERREFLRAFTAVKNALNFTTRGELTYRWWLMLSSEPAASNDDLGVDFNHLLVDEYQDLNECEHQVLELLGRRGVGVFVVGDPNQSIYEGMRHAHPELCDTFVERFADTGVTVLNETYRCPPRVLDVAAALMEGKRGAGGVPTVSHSPEAGDVTIVNYHNETAEASGVAAVARYTAEALPAQRILILYPVRQVGQLVSSALDSIGCAHRFAGRTSEAWDADNDRLAKALARLLGNPSDSLAAATAVILVTAKSRRTDVLVELVEACGRAEADAASYVRRPQADVSTTLQRSIARVATRLDELASLPVDEAIRVLQREFGTEGLERYLLEPEQRRRLEELAGEDQEIGEEDSGSLSEAPPGITLTSYHGSKGLQADTVFLMAIEPDFFEDDPRSNEAERRRLLFVGATRSLDRLILSYATRRYGVSSYISPGPHSNRRGPSDFLTEIRERLEIRPVSGTEFVSSMLDE